jgi:hypothetical protein
MAGEFTNLRDRFRQLAEIESLKSFSEFEASFAKQRDRIEKARQRPLSPPEFCFWLAQRKWKTGDYQPDHI